MFTKWPEILLLDIDLGSSQFVDTKQKKKHPRFTIGNGILESDVLAKKTFFKCYELQTPKNPNFSIKEERVRRAIIVAK